jgi:hypothetical protein
MDAEALERTARRLKDRLDEMEIERHKRVNVFEAPERRRRWPGASRD